MLPLYIDIDGTLTDKPTRDGNPLQNRIDKVKQLISEGIEVIIWTGSGTKYAMDFCRKYDIKPLAAIGKFQMIIDDNPTIRPKENFKIVSPEIFFKTEEEKK